MDRKSSLPEKIAKDVQEVTSSLLPKKSRDAYYKEINYFNNWKQEKRVVLILCITLINVQ
jgi:hypothetical protein